MEEGFTDGVDGSRYALWQDEPKPEDDVAAKKAAEDIKCQVCEVILGHLLETVGMLASEDELLSLLESEPSEAEVEAATAKRDKNLVQLAKGRKGCARHFKDSYLRQGWDVEGCVIPRPQKEGSAGDKQEQIPPWLTVYGTCTKSGQPVQNETKMNTWSVRMEAIYWACQLSLGAHMEAVAAFVAAGLKQGGAEPQALVKEACEKTAKCKTLKYQGTYAQREKEADDKWRKQGEEAVASTIKMQKEEKKAEKKASRRKRRRSSEGKRAEL